MAEVEERGVLGEGAGSGNFEDDDPELSAETFSALAQFYREQEERERRQTDAAVGAEVKDVVKIDWNEDWQLSQFWYSDSTASLLARAVVAAVGDRPARVACVSAPTLYRAIKKLDRPDLQVTVFEHDNRFAAYGADFQFYDYKSPLDIDRSLREQYDLVFADPPFLSEECLTKTAVTMKFLAKEPHRMVLCTGEVMQELAHRLLDLNICKFEPEHENNLANQFRCFANFDLDKLIPTGACATTAS